MDFHRVLTQSIWKPLAGSLVVALTVTCLSGCSLFVLAGKMLIGDPVVPSDFRTQTGVDLAKDQKRLVVVCAAPESVKLDLPSLQLDLTESVHRLLKKHEIKVIDSDRVATWMDDVGGYWTHPSELAQDIDTDYIAQIDIEQIHFHETNSPSMYRGRANGTVNVYEVRTDGELKQAQQIFAKEFRVEYPRHYPVSADQVSLSVFQRRFLDDLSAYLARFFHDYRPGVDF